jgi:catechol 2,3-dioxygenase-like lactoylglutathione lyase family enzyme
VSVNALHRARLNPMDGRPAVWIGHAVLPVSDVDRSADFWRDLGMRELVRNSDVAVLELRGGTHLVLAPGDVAERADAPFDLMVDDLDATHAAWFERGLDPSPITRGRIHASFTVLDPDGYRVTINSSHVAAEV